ncbi:hypothetical protein TNCV_4795361 [Trichonephila clavipes]|nr:hypothetical protein TNCV_4795361 [Trichonephila clavipes]
MSATQCTVADANACGLETKRDGDTLNLSRLEIYGLPWCGSLESAVPSREMSSLLDRGLKLEAPSPE